MEVCPKCGSVPQECFCRNDDWDDDDDLDNEDDNDLTQGDIDTATGKDDLEPLSRSCWAMIDPEPDFKDSDWIHPTL